MPVTAGTGCADGVALSLRLSCDRCRAQKLKCSVPAGSQACQRCKRAKAPCVFGRRTPCKRRRSKTGGGGCGDGGPTSPQIPQLCSPAQQWPVTTPGGLATPPSPVALMHLPVSRSSDFALDRQLDAPMALEPPAVLLGTTMSEMQGGFFDGPATWNSVSSMSPGLQHLDADTSGCGSGTVGYERDWLHLQSGWPLNESAMLELGQPDLALWSQLPTPISTTHRLVAATDAPDGSRKTGNNAAAVVPGQSLIQLVSEMQHQLRQLEDGPWHTDRASGLDDYPVGTVLALAQQFSARVGSILGCMGGEQDKGHPIHGRNEDENDWKMNSPANDDTPTMLLVMCGYMWLARIYDVVLGHFQRHLEQGPANQHSHVGSSTRASCSVYGTFRPSDGRSDNAATDPCIPASPALRLGELRCADATLGLQQIHTAVCMLLDTLHDIESHLGRGGSVGRAMAVTLLLKSGKSPDSDASSGGLSRKASAVKELLRQKMGVFERRQPSIYF